MSHRLLRAGLLGAATLASGAPVWAEESPLVLGGSINTHLQAEQTRSNDGGKTTYTVYDDTDIPLYANWSNWLSVNADIKLERQRNDNLDSYYSTPGSKGNAFFRSEGLTLRQLNATVRPVEGVDLYGGKIHPLFGSAWENMPGQFYSFASDYEQDERIGFGGAVAMPEALGDAKLSAETFFLDNSVLSNSLIARPSLDDASADRARKYTATAGGASNTGSLDSYTIALRGERVPGLEGLKYQLSYTREGVHLADEAEENGWSIGASFDPTGDGIPLTPRWGVTPFVEYTHFTNFGGVDGLRRDYGLAGLNFIHGHWNVAVTGGVRHSSNDKVAPEDQDLSWSNAVATNEVGAMDHQENLSISYEVIEHLQVGAGVNHVRVADRSSNTWGPSLTYSRAF